MNFQALGKIENPDFYLDVAFRRAREKVETNRELMFKTRLKKSQYLENLRIEVVKSYVVSQLEKIIKSFPSLGQLPKFYHELVRCTLDYDDVKKSLGAVQWAAHRILQLFFLHKDKIKNSADIKKINEYRQQFLGRTASILRQIKNELAALEHARRVMKEFPVVKTSLPTAAIVGFPNVGKTTLLYKLTGSKPEINSYPFTTKSINIGNMVTGNKKIQLMDTPGSLNRFNKMNNIEKQAYLAMKHVAERLIYVIDLTEPYPLERQLQLLENLKELKKEIIVFASKADILAKDVLEAFGKKCHVITSADELKELIGKI